MTGLLGALLQDAWAHQGVAPILEVTDYSQLPDAPLGAWLDWSVHPSTVIGCGLMAAFYLYCTGPLREKRGWAEGPDKRARGYFFAAMFTILISLNGPIHELSDNFLFSAHMVQHLGAHRFHTGTFSGCEDDSGASGFHVSCLWHKRSIRRGLTCRVITQDNPGCTGVIERKS